MNMTSSWLNVLVSIAVFAAAGCQPDSGNSGGEAEPSGEKTAIHTDQAPEAIGPYSQAILAGNTLYLSGQIPMDPETGDIVDDDIEQQTRQVLDNLQAVLREAGMSLDDVVKTNVYLADLDEFGVMNDTYAQYFAETEPPARETVEVARLPADVKIEISAVAVRQGDAR